MNNQANEVRLCPTDDCPLFYLRFGKREKKINVLKAIKTRCLDYGEGIIRMVGKCDFTNCPLHGYRQGHNPARKGLGGNGALNFQKGHSAEGI